MTGAALLECKALFEALALREICVQRWKTPSSRERFNFPARLRNLWVDSGTGEWSIEEAAEFAAGGLEGSLLFF